MIAIVPPPSTKAFEPDAGADTGPGIGSAVSLKASVFLLFFAIGGITSLNYVLIAKLKSLFSLGNAEVLLVQSAFFIAFLLFSLPASALIHRFGYMRAAIGGLLAMMAGCVLFAPAASSAQFTAFLVALFVLAAGITVIQVVANPLVAHLGKPEGASSRLTLAQAFNSLGTTVFPHFGSILLLGGLAAADTARLSPNDLDAYRAGEAAAIAHIYLALAAVLALVTLAVWLQRNRLPKEPAEPSDLAGTFRLLRRPRFAMGTLGILLYTGVEVTVGSLLVIYLVQPDTLAASELEAGKLIAWYWGGAMIGRFVGSGVLKVLPPGKVLATAAVMAIALLAVSATTHGPASGYSLIAIGLCNSIMFPTIFALASDGLGRKAADGSGILCMAIVGGAILPPLAGWITDMSTVRTALIVPAAAYMLIALFGLSAIRPAAPLDDAGEAGQAPAAP